VTVAVTAAKPAAIQAKHVQTLSIPTAMLPAVLYPGPTCGDSEGNAQRLSHARV